MSDRHLVLRETIAQILADNSNNETCKHNALKTRERLREALAIDSASAHDLELGHDEETKANLLILQECVNKACKPGRQIRGVAVVLVDANGDAARIVSVSPGYGVQTIGFLEILKMDCVAGLE